MRPTIGSPTPEPLLVERRLAALTGFITARLDEQPIGRLRDITAGWRLLRHLTRLADLEWTGSRAVRDEAMAGLAALASLFDDHPDYQQEWST